MIKTFLALEIRNNLDWLLRFLALEASDFSARILFLDLAVFWLLRLFCAGCASSFSSQFSICILLPSCFLSPTYTEAIGPIAEVVFRMEVSGVASLLNP